MSDIKKYLHRQREVMDLLSEIERKFFWRFSIDPKELDCFANDNNSAIFTDARNRFIKKTSRQAGESMRRLLVEERRKMTVRHFTTADQIIDIVRHAEVASHDPIAECFQSLVVGEQTDLEHISDTILIELYELARLIVDSKGFVNELDVILREWSARRGIRRLSDHCPDDFVDRHHQLENIITFLEHTDGSRPVMHLYGMGGIGKTALVAKALLKQRDRMQSGSLLALYLDLEDGKYRGRLAVHVFFEACQQLEDTAAGGKESFSGNFRDWLTKHGGDKSSMRVIAQRFVEELGAIRHEDQQIVFIFDSLEQYTRVQKLRDRFEMFIVVLTDAFKDDNRFRCITISRSDTPPVKRGSLVMALPVTDLDQSSAIDLLKRRINQQSIAGEDLESVFDIVGGNPLNLKIAADLLAQFFGGTSDINPEGIRLFAGKWGHDYRSQLDTLIIREQLYYRVLDALDDSSVKAIHPGFILRRIDQTVFESVLQPFLHQYLDTELSFPEFWAQVSPFDSIVTADEHGRTLTLNNQIRSTAVELMLKDKPEECQQICERAICHFGSIEKKATARESKLRALADRIYYHLLSGTSGSRIDQIWDPDCFQYLAWSDGLPDRGKAWLATKDPNRDVVPLGWIEQSGLYEQNRLLRRATTYFYDRSDLAKMQTYFRQMEPTAAFANGMLACDVELAYLNFSKVREYTTHFRTMYRDSQRKLFQIGQRIIRAELMSNNYQQGADFLQQLMREDVMSELEESNLLDYDTFSFLVLAFATLVFADDHKQLRAYIQAILEPIVAAMPIEDSKSISDLAGLFIALVDSDDVAVHMELWQNLGLNSRDLDLSLELKTRDTTPHTRLVARDIEVKESLLQAASQCMDRLLWTKAITFATFRRFKRSSELALWFLTWMKGLHGSHSEFSLKRESHTNKGELSIKVVDIAQRADRLEDYVGSLLPNTENETLATHFLEFHRNLGRVAVRILKQDSGSY